MWTASSFLTNIFSLCNASISADDGWHSFKNVRDIFKNISLTFGLLLYPEYHDNFQIFQPEMVSSGFQTKTTPEQRFTTQCSVPIQKSDRILAYPQTNIIKTQWLLFCQCLKTKTYLYFQSQKSPRNLLTLIWCVEAVRLSPNESKF